MSDWEDRAKKKDLPAKFIERLQASKTVDEAEKERIVEKLVLARDVPPPKKDDPPEDPSEDPPTPTEEEALAAGVTTGPTRAPGPAEMNARMRAGQPAYEPGISEEDYVAREVAITKAQMETGLIKTNPIVDGKGRLDRSEAYARWRYRSFMAGEVASL